MIETPISARQEAIARGAGESAKSNHAMLATFRLGGELFVVEGNAVQEITLLARRSIPSGLPVAVAGFLDLAQQPIEDVHVNP